MPAAQVHETLSEHVIGIPRERAGKQRRVPGKHKQSAFRRLTTATRWPVGIALTSWHYLWRTTPMSRSEEQGSWEADAPPPLPGEFETEDLLPARGGAGPHFHRRYSVRIADPELDAEALMRLIRADPDRPAPSEFGTFQKVRGREGEMRVNDEYVVRMPGPWDGPVRVAATTPRSFRLATLEGHLEAGQIEFSVSGHNPLEFRIKSWARSGDKLSELLYDRLRMSKEVQMHMWTSFLERVVKISGGRRQGRLEIRTRKVRPPTQIERGRQLDAMRARKINFDLSRSEAHTPQDGWYADDIRQALPTGSFDAACRIARDYDFAEPSIVEGVFDRDEPLERRTMLLVLHFHFLRIPLGVRVGDVYDETRMLDGRAGRVFGWNYRTLEGHVERGQMDWQVWSFSDDDVLFRISSFAQPSGAGNPFIRLGFRLFGRREQLRFLRMTAARMARLTAEATNGAGKPGTPPAISGHEPRPGAATAAGRERGARAG
jgi:uncharacterized protein (UPF0548 family)